MVYLCCALVSDSVQGISLAYISTKEKGHREEIETRYAMRAVGPTAGESAAGIFNPLKWVLSGPCCAFLP